MQHIRERLYSWYKHHERDLPWRSSNDPYQIWLSEIILQQTRISQGINYFLRFTEAFPTVKALAGASEDQVLRLWQGLGYYSRARNLHKAARQIVTKHAGKFPDTYEAIRALPGIGPYTAAAIASIAFNLPYPAVDGNVYRFLARYFGIDTPIDTTAGKKQFHNLANDLLNQQDPGMHNQALMEFGALQCVHPTPHCHSCPLIESCFAYNHQLTATLPVKNKKLTQQTRYFYFFLIKQGTQIFLEKRPTNDIWAHLYQFPLHESKHQLSDEEITQLSIPGLNPTKATLRSISEEKKHVLSHQIILARLIQVEIEGYNEINPALICINEKDISKFAVPRLLERFWERLTREV